MESLMVQSSSVCVLQTNSLPCRNADHKLASSSYSDESVNIHTRVHLYFVCARSRERERKENSP